jgi:hypothetical protein
MFLVQCEELRINHLAAKLTIKLGLRFEGPNCI